MITSQNGCGIDELLSVAKKAVSLSSDDIKSWDLLGTIYESRGDEANRKQCMDAAKEIEETSC